MLTLPIYSNISRQADEEEASQGLGSVTGRILSGRKNANRDK